MRFTNRKPKAPFVSGRVKQRIAKGKKSVGKIQRIRTRIERGIIREGDQWAQGKGTYRNIRPFLPLEYVGHWLAVAQGGVDLVSTLGESKDDFAARVDELVKPYVIYTPYIVFHKPVDADTAKRYAPLQSSTQRAAVMQREVEKQLPQQQQQQNDENDEVDPCEEMPDINIPIDEADNIDIDDLDEAIGCPVELTADYNPKAEVISFNTRPIIKKKTSLKQKDNSNSKSYTVDVD
jgi:hypothetical protein